MDTSSEPSAIPSSRHESLVATQEQAGGCCNLPSSSSSPPIEVFRQVVASDYLTSGEVGQLLLLSINKELQASLGKNFMWEAICHSIVEECRLGAKRAAAAQKEASESSRTPSAKRTHVASIQDDGPINLSNA